MKTALLAGLVLWASSAPATELLEYFYYVQEEYLQGPWKGGAEAVLVPRKGFREAAGSQTAVEELILESLREVKPSVYAGVEIVDPCGDPWGGCRAVTVRTPAFDPEIFAVQRNELVYSLTENGEFEEVVFRFDDDALARANTRRRFTRADVDVPAFTLGAPAPPPPPVTVRVAEPAPAPLPSEPGEEARPSLRGLLFSASVGLNVLLAAACLWLRRRLRQGS